jgi:hypothetical protein
MPIPCLPYQHCRSSPAAEVDVAGRARGGRGSGGRGGERMIASYNAAIPASSKLSRRRRGMLLAKRTDVVANARSPAAARRTRRQTRACEQIVEKQQHSIFSVRLSLYFSHLLPAAAGHSSGRLRLAAAVAASRSFPLAWRLQGALHARSAALCRVP